MCKCRQELVCVGTSVNSCLHLHTCTYTNQFLSAFTHLYLHKPIPVCIYTHVPTQTNSCLYLHIQTYNTNSCPHLHTCTYTNQFLSAFTHMYLHKPIPVCIYTYKHTIPKCRQELLSYVGMCVKCRQECFRM